MAHAHIVVGAGERPALPAVRRIGLGEIATALRRGFDDFAAMPTHAVFLCLVYPIIGLMLGRMVMGLDILPLLFPLAAGFALLGPCAAIGLYELSRRREAGLPAGAADAAAVLRSPNIDAIAALAFVLLVVFLVWLAVANAIYVAAFGYAPAASIPDFLGRIFSTEAGIWLMIVGNGVGLLFAIVAFSISVISFPMLLDREVGAAGAVPTSLRVVLANPGPMVVWGLIVAAGLIIGSIPAFLGLTIVLPILGHATWHLYRAAVPPAYGSPGF